MVVWDFEETANFLKCTERAVRSKVMRRQIPFRKVAGRIVFIEEELVALVEKAPGLTLDEYLKKADR